MLRRIPLQTQSRHKQDLQASVDGTLSSNNTKQQPLKNKTKLVQQKSQADPLRLIKVRSDTHIDTCRQASRVGSGWEEGLSRLSRLLFVLLASAPYARAGLGQVWGPKPVGWRALRTPKGPWGVKVRSAYSVRLI